jgi:hypothetical protein
MAGSAGSAVVEEVWQRRWGCWPRKRKAGEVDEEVETWLLRPVVYFEQLSKAQEEV